MNYKAERQTDGSYLFVVPAGADMTALALTFALPSGATVSPASGSEQDFSKGPVTYIVTAADGKTIAKIIVAVKTESPAPTEKNYFSGLASDCEIVFVLNADGTATAYLRIPFLPGSDPALIEAIRAAISGVAISNVSYAYVDADGNVVPITARAAKSAFVEAPYLEIAFTAPSLDAVKKGVLEKVEYWLKDDATEYAQTYSSPFAFSEIAFTDETPEKKPGEEDSGGSGGGGCDAGAGLAGAMVLLSGVAAARRTGKRKTSYKTSSLK
jgi:hypothetical protein